MTKLLLIVKVPPPVTGATLMNQIILDHVAFGDGFKKQAFPISYVKKTGALGKIGIRKGLIFFKVVLRLLKVLFRDKPDLVYFQISTRGVALYRDVLLVGILRLFKKRIVYHLHAKGIDKQMSGSRLKQRIYQYTFSQQHVIFLSHKFVAEIPSDFNHTSHVIPNGILPYQERVSPLTLKPDQPIRLLFLSNLIETKGILDFVEVLKKLDQMGVNFSARVIGADADVKASQLQEVLKDCALIEKVEVMGPVYGKEKWKFLNEAQIMLFPTFYELEAFPLVILEAFQCGTPVLAYNEGAIEEMINQGHDGFVFDSRDIDAMATKVKELAMSPETLEELSNNAISTFQNNYTAQAFSQKLSHTLRLIAENKVR